MSAFSRAVGLGLICENSVATCVCRIGVCGYGYIHGYPRKICGCGYGYTVDGIHGKPVYLSFCMCHLAYTELICVLL